MMPVDDVLANGRPPSATLIDENTPSVARAYSYLLGGKDYYKVDLQVVRSLERVFKDPARIALSNRHWLERVVRWLARDAGIRQFIDCGSGLPQDDNVHQIAQRYNPEAKVIYSDNDATVQAHGRALLEENENTAFIGADLREPDKLFDDQLVHELIDFEQPVAVIQCATLHHVSDEPRPIADIVRDYVRPLAPGSYLAISHVIYPPEADDPDGRGREVADELRNRVRTAGLDSGYWRSYEHVLGFFDGLDLVEPGLVRTGQWWPDGPTQPAEVELVLYGAVGKKP